MIKKKTHKNLYKQLLHVKKKIKKVFKFNQLFLLFSTEISSTEYRDVSYVQYRDVLIPKSTPPPPPQTLVRLVKELILMLLIKIN